MRDRLTTCTAIWGRKTIGPDRWYATVLYALRGEVTATTGDKSWALSSAGASLLVANEGERLEVAPAFGALAAIIRVDMRSLRRSLNDRMVTFSCTPLLRHQAAYGELARLTEELLRADAEQGDFAAIHRSGAELAFIRGLLDGFGGVLAADATRAEAFISYVDAHFDEPLTLADAARHFNLSSEYFSKAFKAETGQTFHGYLTEVRLDAATKSLLSEDDTIARIALEAGFPNLAAMSQAFKQRYGTTPTCYRNEHQESSERTFPGSFVSALRETSREAKHDESSKALLVRADARGSVGALRRPWRDSIGLSKLSSLSDARVRDQVRWLQQRLGFGHMRVGADFGRYVGGQGLYELENSFDFLVDVGAAPHVLLDYDQSADTRRYLESFSGALRHLINRYSVKTVGAWRFELRMNGREQTESYAPYLTFFAQMSEMLRSYGIEEPLAGPSLYLDQDVDNLRRFLRNARDRGVALPTVSIGSRPAHPTTVGGNTVLVRTADPHYLRNQVLLAREVLAQEGFGSSRLVVGSWRDSLESQNIMNDSCYEGARIMQTALSVWDCVDSICYNDALDLFEEANAHGAFLSGAPGLINRDGIPKPSYYAFDFLSHLNERLIFADEAVLVSANDMGNYQVVCHNCKRLNAAYLATPEDQLDYQLIDTYFEELGPREVRVRLEGVKNGTYLIKKRFVSEAGGSLGDEAVRMRLWCMDAPSRSELERLRAAAHPLMNLERHVVTDGVLEFAHTLQSNEIAYFHIIYLY